MKELELIKNWNTLKTELSKILDYKTRRLYYQALLVRAVSEWGFNPEKPTTQSEQANLDDWEKELVEDINDFKMFGIDTRAEKRQNIHKEALVRMKDFILHGGNKKDIPSNINVSNLYTNALLSIVDDVCAEADNLLTKDKK